MEVNLKNFDDLIKSKDLKHCWIYTKNPKMNAYNEKLNRALQESFIDDENLLLTDMKLFNELKAKWLIDYNTTIPHHSLLMKTP